MEESSRTRKSGTTRYVTRTIWRVGESRAEREPLKCGNHLVDPTCHREWAARVVTSLSRWIWIGMGSHAVSDRRRGPAAAADDDGDGCPGPHVGGSGGVNGRGALLAGAPAGRVCVIAIATAAGKSCR